jgi:hypothetical protein
MAPAYLAVATVTLTDVSRWSMMALMSFLIALALLVPASMHVDPNADLDSSSVVNYTTPMVHGMVLGSFIGLHTAEDD